MMLALTSFLPPIISSRPVGLETDQGPPLLLPSRSITCRCNHFAGTHWAPKVVPFLAVDDNQRNGLCVCAVRPWKRSVELKGAELAAATVAPAVAQLRRARTEGRTLVWRPTRSILTLRQVRRKRTSWEKPLRVLIARRRPTSRSWCSFLAKVHGQSVLRHGQSSARNPRFQRTHGGRARTGHGLDSSIFGISPFGLRASSRVRPTRKERRLDDRGRSEKGTGPRGTSRSACHCSPVATVVQRPLPGPARSRYDQGIHLRTHL
jgi:hypothetical protein